MFRMNEAGEIGHVVAVACDDAHRFTKPCRDLIHLIEGLGVAGDAHAGVSVQHRSRVAKDPDQPNLRQVHLIHAELFDELAERGFAVGPGRIGENITVRGIALLDLPTDTILRIGDDARIRITGLRNPCLQLEAVQAGLMQAVLARAPDGSLIRKAGVMAVVVAGGEIRPGDTVRVTVPTGQHRRLEAV
ncbi:MOSC domain-containing protein YiiM [Sphingomonas sp. UYAg733]